MPNAETLPEVSSLSAHTADLGKYRLIAELARGGMGVVHVAVVQGLAGFTKLLVVKELRADFVDDDAFVSMFFDEARVAARLNHPNIVQTIEVGSEGRRHYLAMEYLEGQTLHRIIRRARQKGDPLPLLVHLRVLVEVLSALEYAHSLATLDGTALGLVHRDVSPHNILVTYEGHTKLVDFGIAKTLTAAHETRGGVLKGKTTYMSPEQAACGVVDRRTDVFAVGLMLWEAVVGRRPWEGQNDVAILRSLLASEVPRLEDALPNADPTLAAIVARATHADAENRYPTALAMRDDLESYIALHDNSALGHRDLSAFVSQLFAEDRQQLQQRIDAQLRALGDEREPVSGISSSGSPPSGSSIRVETSVETSSGSRLSRPPEPEVTEEQPASVAPSAIWSPAPPPERPRRWFFAGVLAAMATVAVVFSLDRGLERRWLRFLPSAQSTAATLPPGAGAARTAQVTIIASPPSAQLYVDDVLVGNPYAATRPIDAAAHRVRAVAPGYVTQTLGFGLSGGNVNLSVALDRAAEEQATPARSAPAKTLSLPAAAAASAILPDPFGLRGASAGDSVTNKPSRDIDTENPYAR